MPHTFLPRSRKPAIGVSHDDIKKHFLWEAINATSYLLGGIVFIVGSVYFLPKYEEQVAIGCWLFVAGSILYLVVSLHDVSELYHSKGKTKWIDWTAAILYIAGSVIFVVGSVYFLPANADMFTAGSWCFVVGSIMFILGAVVNSMQIFEAETQRGARTMNLVAISFVIGSLLFLLGSVPYLMTFTEDDTEMVYAFLGWMFIVGSVFFFLGGVINGIRVWFLMKEDLKKIKEEKAGENSKQEGIVDEENEENANEDTAAAE